MVVNPIMINNLAFFLIARQWVGPQTKWQLPHQTALRKRAYSDILKLLQPKKENFQKKSDIFHISAQNIDYGYSLEPPRRGGSNEYP